MTGQDSVAAFPSWTITFIALQSSTVARVSALFMCWWTKLRLILGFYTLSAAQVDSAELSDADRKTLPRYPIPCFRLGRLACRTDRPGLGELLIGCAVERCLQARKQVAAFALIVDAKSPEAKAFYEHYGFTPCVDASMTLYLPLG